jgi:hypothetical protein
MSATSPTSHVYLLLRTDYQRLPNEPQGYTFTTCDPEAILVTASYKSALQALLRYKRHITHGKAGDYMSRDCVLCMCRDTIYGADLVLTPRSHSPPIEIRLRILGVDVGQDEDAMDLSKLCAQSGDGELRTPLPEGHDPDIVNTALELRSLKRRWRVDTTNVQKENDNTESNGGYYSDLPTGLGRSLPETFAGHSIDGSVRTLKWKRHV